MGTHGQGGYKLESVGSVHQCERCSTRLGPCEKCIRKVESEGGGVKQVACWHQRRRREL